MKPLDKGARLLYETSLISVGGRASGRRDRVLPGAEAALSTKGVGMTRSRARRLGSIQTWTAFGAALIALLVAGAGVGPAHAQSIQEGKITGSVSSDDGDRKSVV